MVHLQNLYNNLLNVISKAKGLPLLTVLFYALQSLTHVDFICSCKPSSEPVYEAGFFIATPFVFTSIIILKRLSCNINCICCCSVISKFLLSFPFVLGAWVSAALFDGDWYVCYMTRSNTTQTGIPCEEKLTFEAKVIKNGYQRWSHVYGFIAICALLLLWNVCECIQVPCFGFLCKFNFCGCECSESNNPSHPYYQRLYDDFLSEEVSNYLEEELRGIAKERAKTLCEKHIKVIRHHKLGGDGNPSDRPDDKNSKKNSDGNSRDNDGGDSPGRSDGNSPEHATISDTWQKISFSYFYCMDENQETSNRQQLKYSTVNKAVPEVPLEEMS